GTHLVSWKHEKLEPLQVFVLPLGEGEDPERAVEDWHARRVAWHDSMEAGRAEMADDPAALGPVVRMYEFDPRSGAEFGSVIDFRTGMLSARGVLPEFLRAAILAGLPLDV